MYKALLQNGSNPASLRSIGRLIAFAALALLLGVALSQTPASAAAYNYNTNAQLHTINVGFIMLDSANQTGPLGTDHPG
ncbi:MAG TPA: hypothetical protein VFW40_11765, partial [Capsulimonadaceae bacterium]|nr:hypothetical protein [Capsulimonadaceae bacterium]